MTNESEFCRSRRGGRIGGRIARLTAALAMFAGWAVAGQFAVGYVSWDVTFPDNAGRFNIVNLTGANSLEPDFPITSQVDLSGLILSVQFSDSTIPNFSGSYFTPSSDGHSFDGTELPLGGTNPFPVSFSLTGQFNSPTITTADGDFTIVTDFSAAGAGTPYLADGATAIIYATTADSGAPEPATWCGALCGLAMVFVKNRRRMAR